MEFKIFKPLSGEGNQNLFIQFLFFWQSAAAVRVHSPNKIVYQKQAEFKTVYLNKTCQKQYGIFQVLKL